MNCDDCEAIIDPETDRHLIITERLVAPEWGVEGTDGRALCESCMDPQCATLAPEA